MDGGEARRLRVGRVVRPHGVRGQVKVKWLAPESPLAPRATLYLGPEAETPGLQVVAVRPLNPPFLLLTLEGCSTREAAEALRGATLWMAREALPELEGDAYYVEDLLGMRVETGAGALLGTVVEVIETGAADVYVVRGEAGEVLLPATREVVRRVDVAARLMVVTPLPGMVA